MPMYSVVEYCWIYLKQLIKDETKDETNNFNADFENNNDFKSFK